MTKRTEIKLTEHKTLVLETTPEERDYGRSNQIILKATCQDRVARWIFDAPAETTYDEIKNSLEIDPVYAPEQFLELIIDNQGAQALMPLLYADSENLIPLVMDGIIKIRPNDLP